MEPLTPLIVDAAKSTPAIRFEPAEGRLVLRGESYPENAAKFYAPLFAALEAYLASSDTGSLQVDLEMIYLNSSSSKIFFNLFDRLEKAASEGLRVTINWRYSADNDTAQTCGEEFQEDADRVTFNLIEIE